MTGIIDRFEGIYAVIELENNTIKNIDRNKIPKEAKEGYVLEMDDCITINYEETEIRRKKIDKLTENLWKE